MNLINGFLKFIGINTFIAFLVLLMLGYEDTSMVLLVISLSSFAILLFLELYKFYLVNNIKKNKPKDN